MDIDFYSIQNYIAIGDTQATISLTSGQDFVMINNIITVLNSQLPDATVTIDQIDTNSDSRELTIDYTISNTNSTAVLPQNTPIAFYADGILIGTAATQVALPIGGSTQQTITVTIPASIPDTFDLTVVVDDDGTGTGTVDEINEDNNVALETVTLPTSPVVPLLNNLLICDNIVPIAFDLTSQEIGFSNPAFTFQYYETFQDASDMMNTITNPTEYSNTTYPTTIYLEVTNSINLCRTIAEFDLVVLESPIINQPPDLIACILDTTEVSTFDLTINETSISNELSIIFNYYETFASDGTFQDEITNPTAYDNTTNPQTIYVTVENSNGCISHTSFNLIVSDCEIYIPAGLSPNDDGKNDVFNILNLEAHPNHELHIYNRLGTLIFIGNKNTGRWNGYANKGTPKNKRLPTGTYFYVLYLNDTNVTENTSSLVQRYTGWVYLQNN
jgi:gliding motility-associated-like protein